MKKLLCNRNCYSFYVTDTLHKTERMWERGDYTKIIWKNTNEVVQRSFYRIKQKLLYQILYNSDIYSGK